jgi:hypothetical protein
MFPVSQLIRHPHSALRLGIWKMRLRARGFKQRHWPKVTHSGGEFARRVAASLDKCGLYCDYMDTDEDKFLVRVWAHPFHHSVAVVEVFRWSNGYRGRCESHKKMMTFDITSAEGAGWSRRFFDALREQLRNAEWLSEWDRNRSPMWLNKHTPCDAILKMDITPDLWEDEPELVFEWDDEPEYSELTDGTDDGCTQ